jgi:6-phosphogluconolactonase/glucosamine-6-phosphate isomerase/deaminase
MKFVATTGWEDGIAAQSRRLAVEQAAGKKVLCLTSGGSNIGASVHIMETVPAELQHLLTIMPADERYGEPGHKDSNWQQLLDSDFRPGNANLAPVLQAGLSFEATAERYNQMVKQAVVDNQAVIAQLGIGEDGHIAGILPNSQAANKTDDLAICYQSQPHRRLTLSFAGLRCITAAYAFAFGAPKAEAIQKLQTKELSLSEQPSQILKELPEAYLFSDQLKAT